MKDHPGQTLMPFAAEERPAARPLQGYCKGAETDPSTILPLPAKATVTPPEAARVLGCTARQIRFLVDDGTLLAIDVGRHVARRSRDQRTPWRVVVRRGTEFDKPEFEHFLTLEEFVGKRSNLEV